MSNRSWVVLGAAVLAMAVIALAWVRWDASAGKPSGSQASSGASRTLAPDPSSAPAVTSDPTPTPTQTSTPTSSVRPSRPPAATPPPRASGPARLAYASFLRRVNDDRATVERLNASLTTAVQALDPVAARSAAVDILDFVDAERDWLRENPPAACYANAHTSAGAMLDAYGAAADAFIAWAETGGGFAGLNALGHALDEAKAAGDSLTTFGHVLETTSCAA